MIEIHQTEVYEKWFDALRDRTARNRILARIRRLSLGLTGDAKPVGQGVSELRIHYGPGYRIYFGKDGDRLLILLGGSTKKRQQHDINAALANWQDYKRRK